MVIGICPNPCDLRDLCVLLRLGLARVSLLVVDRRFAEGCQNPCTGTVKQLFTFLLNHSLYTRGRKLAMLVRRLALTIRGSPRLFSSKGRADVETAIAELNQEMQFIFGEPAPSGFAGSDTTHHLTKDTQATPPKLPKNEQTLTHTDSRGEAQMVDVSGKASTKRSATASCKVILGKKVFDLVSANQLAKGDVLSVAKIAGIMGAKQAENLIPLCHNIRLSHIRVDLGLNAGDYSVEIEGEASTTEKTGVEMEVLTAVTVAGLTVYDMCKAASKDILITDVRLEKKTGGKSGDWLRKER